EQTAPMARQRAADFKKLLDKNFVSQHGYLDSEQTRIEQEADLANFRSRANEIEAALRQARTQRAQLLAETRRVSLDGITNG
ncbi:MAG: hemolysin secretion protein D, partial [Neisseriaceae bacterium]|nr:hemolysin secretion protein D [Neisseriaceae bacterium]